MNSPNPRKTIIVPFMDVTAARSGGGRFFRSSTGAGGTGEFTKKGVRAGGYAWPGKQGVLRAARQGEEHAAYRFAFSLLYLFTLLLYARPNDLIPAMGEFPLAKIVAIIAPLAYIYARYSLGKPIINWTIEVKMVIVMLFLAVLFTPIAASPGDSAAALSDVFIKTVIIFILIIGLVNTRERLQAMIKLTTFCGTWLAVFAIKNYATGNLTMKGDRIEGLVGGMFGNPNDLAAAFNLLIPLAVALALMNAGGARLLYAACALLMSGGTLVTFSRAGFITLAAVSGVMLWKFGRGSRSSVAIATLIAAVLLFSVFSGAYRSRLSTILDPDADESGSAQQRIELLKRGLSLSLGHPIIGLGIGNFHIYSISEMVAHNGYLETSAELGTIGLLAYLVVILAPLVGLNRIEMQTIKSRAGGDLDAKYLSVGLQAALIAYAINSFFLSIQYLWYLYYAAGFAVALRLIYAAEKASQANEGEAAAPSHKFKFGNQWKSDSRKPAGSLWPAYQCGGPAVREGAFALPHGRATTTFTEPPYG
ncbi:MAG TPA: O-antigen ligase family protein [Blastocatellia bacterium]